MELRKQSHLCGSLVKFRKTQPNRMRLFLRVLVLAAVSLLFNQAHASYNFSSSLVVREGAPFLNVSVLDATHVNNLALYARPALAEVSAGLAVVIHNSASTDPYCSLFEWLPTANWLDFVAFNLSNLTSDTLFPLCTTELAPTCIIAGYGLDVVVMERTETLPASFATVVFAAPDLRVTNLTVRTAGSSIVVTWRPPETQLLLSSLVLGYRLYVMCHASCARMVIDTPTCLFNAHMALM
jgi:hypothetical protein